MKCLILIFLFCSAMVFSQQKRFSCCFFGTKLYDKPSEGSRLMDSIPFGDSVEFVSTHKKEESILSKSGFPLKSHWVCVSYKNKKGYVFGADLSSKRVEASLFEAENPGYLGKLIERRIIDVGTVENFGSGYRVSRYFDGCEDEEIVLRGYSLNEVYHILIRSYSDITGSEFPLYSGQVETKFHFGGVGATIVISLEPLPQEQFRITSYACD